MQRRAPAAWQPRAHPCALAAIALATLLATLGAAAAGDPPPPPAFAVAVTAAPPPVAVVATAAPTMGNASPRPGAAITSVPPAATTGPVRRLDIAPPGRRSPRCRLRGLVTDGLGTPRSAFPITVQRDDGRGRGEPQIITTAADGTFALDTGGPGTFALHAGAPDRREGPVVFAQATATDAAGIRLLVPAPAELHLRLDADGVAAPADSVAVLRHAELPLQERRGSCDADGTVRIAGLPTGPWLLTVQCAHGGCCDHPLTIHAGRNVVTVALLPGRGPSAQGPGH